MAREHDIAVIGGGLVGGAIAYGLARLGRRVCLYDEGDVAYRASRGNFGLVWVQGKGQGLAPYGGWTQRSVRRFAEFAALLREDTGIDVALEQPGGFHLCLSDAELAHRVDQLTRLVAQQGFERYAFEVLNERLTNHPRDFLPRNMVDKTLSTVPQHPDQFRERRQVLNRCAGHSLRQHIKDTWGDLPCLWVRGGLQQA